MLNQLINATLPTDIVYAVFNAYNITFGGYFIAILYVIFQAVLLMKTKSLTLSFISSVLLISVFFGTSYMVSSSANVIVIISVVELAAIVWAWFMK